MRKVISVVKRDAMSIIVDQASPSTGNTAENQIVLFLQTLSDGYFVPLVRISELAGRPPYLLLYRYLAAES